MFDINFTIEDNTPLLYVQKSYFYTKKYAFFFLIYNFVSKNSQKFFFY